MKDYIVKGYARKLSDEEASSTYGYTKVLTNQSAANWLSTNQNRAFHPCDFYDVTLAPKTHVTP